MPYPIFLDITFSFDNSSLEEFDATEIKIGSDSVTKGYHIKSTDESDKGKTLIEILENTNEDSDDSSFYITNALTTGQKTIDENDILYKIKGNSDFFSYFTENNTGDSFLGIPLNDGGSDLSYSISSLITIETDDEDSQADNEATNKDDKTNKTSDDKAQHPVDDKQDINNEHQQNKPQEVILNKENDNIEDNNEKSENESENKDNQQDKSDKDKKKDEQPNNTEDSSKQQSEQQNHPIVEPESNKDKQVSPEQNESHSTQETNQNNDSNEQPTVETAEKVDNAAEMNDSTEEKSSTNNNEEDDQASKQHDASK